METHQFIRYLNWIGTLRSSVQESQWKNTFLSTLAQSMPVWLRGGWYWCHSVRVTGEPSDHSTSGDDPRFQRPIQKSVLSPESAHSIAMATKTQSFQKQPDPRRQRSHNQPEGREAFPLQRESGCLWGLPLESYRPQKTPPRFHLFQTAPCSRTHCVATSHGCILYGCTASSLEEKESFRHNNTTVQKSSHLHHIYAAVVAALLSLPRAQQ